MFWTKVVKMTLFATLIAILSILVFFSYNEYKNTIISQQQKQMLGIASSISESIDLFLDDVVASMRIITLDKEYIKGISMIEKEGTIDIYYEKLKAYSDAQGEQINAVYFFDDKGVCLTQYSKNKENIYKDFKEEINKAVVSRETYIGKTYLDKVTNTFFLNVYEPIFDGQNFRGVVSAAINLDVIYDKLIAPVKIGEKGYALVKNQQGTIIMHTVKEQVGMDVIESRKQVFPGLDYRELEVLIKDQLTGKEGTAIYHSYWWAEDVLKKVKKLNAYTPVYVGENFWVVAITMSYDEIQRPITKFLGIIIVMASLIAIIIYFFISQLMNMKKNKEKLEKETEYLKRLNETSEELRLKEAEMYHSHKLKMIGTLAGGIAHDINNLLTPILGYSELLLMTLPESSDHHENVEEIYKASQRGKDLIEQLLVFSRNESGMVKVEPVNINEVLKQCIKLLKSVRPKNVIIKEKIEKNCGYIHANFTQIHQVIFNLCTNAIQAIENEVGEIEVSLHTLSSNEVKDIVKQTQEESSYIEIIVKDTGCGMDEETKKRIFDPFFTTKAKEEGTGLGLFVVQSIIDKYKGAIVCESEVGKGSCFKIYLPLLKEAVGIEHKMISKQKLIPRKKVLVVDDNEEVLRVLKKELEHLGCEVVTEMSSTSALKRFQVEYNDIELVITDYIMPELKGDKLAEGIKFIKKDTVVILMTGYMDEKEKTIDEIEAIDDYIFKPIELTKLSELLKK
jgi:signal transduction histidine kinase/CheY-like chemotaxis protein